MIGAKIILSDENGLFNFPDTLGSVVSNAKDSAKVLFKNERRNENLVNDTTFCNSITISINNTWNKFNWSTGATTSSITLSSAGTYSVTVLDMYGCSALDRFILSEQPYPSPYFSYNYITYNSVQFEGWYYTNYSYTWDFGDGSNSATIYNPIHTYQNEGTYTVRLTVNDGCTGRYYEKEVIIDLSGINDAQELEKIKINPNPFTKKLYIELPHQNFKFLELNIYDLTGKLVFQNPDKNIFNLINVFDVNTLSKGAYYLIIITDKGNLTRKVFVF